MKRVFKLLLEYFRDRLGQDDTFHDDTLRANQSDRGPTFSFWRALVS